MAYNDTNAILKVGNGSSYSPSFAGGVNPIISNPVVNPTAATSLASFFSSPQWNCSAGCSANLNINEISSYTRIGSSWADGNINLIADFNPGGVTSNPNSVTYSNYQGYASTVWACGNGQTITTNCYQADLVGFTGIPGASATLNNITLGVGLSTGAVNATGSTENIIGVQIFGNCPTAVLGTQTCFGIKEASTAANQFAGQIQFKNGIVDNGTKFTLSSGTGACASTSTLVGGAFSGSFLCTGTAGASTIVVTFGTVTNGPPNNVSCNAHDDTSGVVWSAKSSSATGTTLTGTIATTSDKVIFDCPGF